MPKRPKPILLTVLDGWGYSPKIEGNAIALARKPNYDALVAKFPNTLIHTSGPWVGLPEGQMGNSEVGHLNIGAGRIVQMDITRIDRMIATGEFYRHPLLVEAIRRGRENQLHLMGLLSDGGIHSHIEHLFALLRMAAENKAERVFLHCFTDGRDTPPTSGQDYLRLLGQRLREYSVGRIATVAGRYYAMDRDNRWPRIEVAYRAIVHGEADHRSTDPVSALGASYEHDVTDEFVEPVVITDAAGEPVARVRDRDAIIFFNFRADRARELTAALALKDFSGFARPRIPQVGYVCMTEYDRSFNLPVAFGPEDVRNTLAEVFAREKIRNVRIAETEKYAHVTYFFNGGREQVYPGEDRVLVPSPKVATYDMQPEMSSEEVTEHLVGEIHDGYDLIVVNYANTDMVGHNGSLTAAGAGVLPSSPAAPSSCRPNSQGSVPRPSPFPSTPNPTDRAPGASATHVRDPKPTDTHE